MKKEIELSFFKLFHLITEFSTLKFFAINHLNSIKFPFFIQDTARSPHMYMHAIVHDQINMHKDIVSLLVFILFKHIKSINNYLQKCFSENENFN